MTPAHLWLLAATIYLAIGAIIGASCRKNTPQREYLNPMEVAIIAIFWGFGAPEMFLKWLRAK